MIFRETWRQVFDGTKTQTRRLIKPGESAVCADGQWRKPEHVGDHTITGIYSPNRHPSYLVGGIYAVQRGRGQRAIAHLKVTGIRYAAHAYDISDEDAKAEGFGQAEEFYQAFGKANGSFFRLDEAVWVITFTVIERWQPHGRWYREEIAPQAPERA